MKYRKQTTQVGTQSRLPGPCYFSERILGANREDHCLWELEAKLLSTKI